MAATRRTAKTAAKGLAMALLIDHSGDIKVVDGRGRPVKALTPDQFSESIPGKTLKKSEVVTIMQSNPCTWLNIQGCWYRVCW